MANLFSGIRRIVDNGKIQLIVGLILLAYALTSIFTDYFTLHHGIMATVLYQLWGAIPNILQALERVSKGAKTD